MHDLNWVHRFCGAFIAWAFILHSIAHLVRWSLHSELKFLTEHRAGVTGLICLILTPLIAVPSAAQLINTT